ncbi:hypothetical protein ACIRPR_11870 [Streptomyces griseoflavus]|uniref:hypothetical protein n=1 Tax=Streptomyces griseoflavus TaxID=35619 RepID=UPI00167F18F9|nr:hypothetical protein [Streptomyces griseoflavus]GGV11116.1 hypothetical protein GCM10010293_01120 [Streptomyces griseoflavus]
MSSSNSPNRDLKVGGALASAAVGLAATAVKGWASERKARKAIVRTFYAACLDDQKNLREDRMKYEVASLVFEVSSEEKTDWGSDRYCEVKVTNSQLAGDDSKRVRTFRYFFGNRSSAMNAKKGSVSWPPYILHSTPDF